MQGPVPVLYKRHFTALSSAQKHQHLHHFPQTHPARTQPCLFIIRRSHQVGRRDRGVSGGPLIIPRWPSTGVKTSLFYILSFCIRMAGLLSGTKCTLNLSGGAIVFPLFFPLLNKLINWTALIYRWKTSSVLNFVVLYAFPIPCQAPDM